MSAPTPPSPLEKHTPVRTHAHPVNRRHHDEASLGERLADRIASGIGSWTFLVVQTALVVAWMGGNAYFLFHFDAPPFILLNLLFSIQAAYTGPVLLLAGNRQAQKDRLTLEHAEAEAVKTEHATVKILSEIKHNTEITVRIIEHLERQQAEILAKQ